ncbi:MAG TPA: hypothetical protein VFN74_20110 [Chloroflexota bacterium]|nr:hypothetical protein [Chloroflexota bacterium]
MLSTVLAAGSASALASTAGAADEWCEVDPAVVIRTPGGNKVVVHVTYAALGREHQATLRETAISTTVRAAGPSATDVEIQVLIPNDRFATGFQTRSMVSTLPFGKGTPLASDQGKSGQAMKLRFRLDVA